MSVGKVGSVSAASTDLSSSPAMTEEEFTAAFAMGFFTIASLFVLKATAVNPDLKEEQAEVDATE
jgi:hypothetical protein